MQDNSNNDTSRVLGIAFILQFITSLSSGAILRQAWLIPGDMGATMVKIAGHAALFRTNILVDMVTALGIVFLGAMLFVTLRRHDEKTALVAMGFYFMDAVLLAASKIAAVSLLRLSQEYVATGRPAALLTLGNLALESMDYVGMQLHMLAFSFGAVLFYYLLYRSEALPSAMSIWGLITVLPCLAATVLAIYGLEPPFFLYIPHIPVELVVGAWILVKGIRDGKTKVALGVSAAKV